MDYLPGLRSFLAVYRSGSISRAAESLNLTQPAVTRQLQQLEARLERQLFRRVPRGVVPSAAGDELARRVGTHLDALEALTASMRLGVRELAGTVFIGGPAEFLSVKLLPGLTELPDHGIRLRAEFHEPEALKDALLLGTLDLAVFTVRRTHPKLEFVPLFEEELVLVGARAWAQRLPTNGLSAAQLEGVPLLAYAEDLPLLRRYWKRVFQASVNGEAALVIPDLRGLEAAAVAGVGVTVLPRYLLEASLASGRLVELHTPARAPVNQLYLGWRAAPQPRVAFLIDLVQRTAKAW